MNILRASWCRAYQFAFRAALPVLPYRTPEELGSVFEIPIRLRQLGVGSVLLVTDKQLRSLGLTAPLEKAPAPLCRPYHRRDGERNDGSRRHRR